MAYSIHRLLIVPAALATLALGGCQKSSVATTALTNRTPIATDEAMSLRQWDGNRALYSNGYVETYPTLYPYQSSPKTPDLVNMAWEPALFIGQTVALPVTAVATPAWNETACRGVYMPPTFTADIPLEPIR